MLSQRGLSRYSMASSGGPSERRTDYWEGLGTEVPLADSFDDSRRPTPVGVALIADQDSFARSGMRRLLEGWGINVYEAGTAELALLCACRVPLTCVVIEHLFADGTGIEVAGRIALLRPEVRIAFVTSAFYFSTLSDSGRRLERQAAAVTFLQKPLMPDDARRLRAFLLDRLPARENPPP